MKLSEHHLSDYESAKVYVVDDEPEYCKLLAEQLKTARLNVEHFRTAKEFLRAYDPLLPGCLILDLRLPDMNGLELLRLLSNQENHIPVIMLTAFADVPTAVKAMKLGALDVLEKPHHPLTLIELVQRAVREDTERTEKFAIDSETAHGLETLTPREFEVLKLVLEGMAAKQIANALKISVRTVDFHRRNLLEKMHIDNLVQLARRMEVHRNKLSSLSPR